MLKFIDVLNAAKRIVAARAEWNMQDGPNIPWQGALTKMISEPLDIAIRESCDFTADVGQEVEHKAHALILCLDDIAHAHQRWLQDASMGLPTAPPRGSDELHRVLDRLEVQLKTNELPLPAPIKQLREQGVSPNQIAIIYGWKLEDGGPDCQKVFDELEKPGTHFDPKKWIHPSRKAVEAEIAQRWSTRTPRERLFHIEVDNAKSLEKPPVPTLDELLEVKAPVAQIMRLHNMTEQEVLEAAEAAGVDLLQREIVPANANVALQERMATAK